jgi:hypothetical protein
LLETISCGERRINERRGNVRNNFSARAGKSRANNSIYPGLLKKPVEELDVKNGGREQRVNFSHSAASGKDLEKKRIREFGQEILRMKIPRFFTV